MPDRPLRVMADTNVLIIERDWLPVVMIVSLREGRVDEQYFLEFSRRLGRAAHRQGLTEEELLRELEEDRRALYRETYVPRPDARTSPLRMRRQ